MYFMVTYLRQKENLCFYHWCQNTIDSYISETKAGVLPKHLTDLHNPEAMKMSYSVLLDECESIHMQTVSSSSYSWKVNKNIG